MNKFIALICLFGLQVHANNGFAQKSNTSPDRPNIIFILTDDQRFDAIGYADNKFVQTPEMDRLAETGVYFETAIVTTPICAASRASLFTGLYERSHNFNFQTGNIRDEYMEDSYPTVLKNNGYYTAFFGKYGVTYDHLEKQFDEYDSYDRNNQYPDRRGYYYKTIDGDTVHLTRYTGQQALDFIDKAPSNQPFSLSLSFSAPHAHDGAPEQYFWQTSTDQLLQNTTIPPAALSEDKYFLSQPQFVRDGFNRLRWTWRYDTEEKYQHSLKGYYRMISGIDLEIAKIRQKLAEKGLDKNTVIILMGDNGYFLGERQLAGKWLMYDNSVRVPLIIYDPRVGKHQDVKDMVLNVDVPATIADLAGVEAPASWHGKSLLPIVTGKDQKVGRDTVLIEHIWEFDEIPPSEGVRTEEWKYFRYVNDQTVEELYHLKDDPQEINNLVHDSQYKAVADKLRAKTDELITKYSNKYRAAPSHLTVELIADPQAAVEIVDTKPEFGWRVPEYAKSQSAYQILVSSSEEQINSNLGDVWNSAQVRTAKSTNVEYQGKALEVGKNYYWKVRIWDDENRVVDYSKPQKFTVGKNANGMIATANVRNANGVKSRDLEEASAFESSDAILNEVWGLSKSSLESSSASGSQTSFESKAYLNQLSQYSVSADYAAARTAIEYFMEHPTGTTEWQLHVALMFYADYMYTGNTELIEKYYDALKYKTLYASAKGDGLITSTKMDHDYMRKLGFNDGFEKGLTDIVDMPAAKGEGQEAIGNLDGFVFKPYNTVVNAFFYENMRIMAEFAKIMGKAQEALEFDYRAAQVKKSLNEQMFDPKRGVYVDGIDTDHASLHANMMPLAFGLVPEEYKDSVVEFIKSRGMACSVYGSQYLMEGLYRAADQDYALSLLVGTGDRSWSHMIRQESSMEGEAVNSLDWDHPWGAVPANIIPRALWGIQPKTPGFGIARIQPQLSTLKSSAVEVPTVLGPIKANYVFNNARLQTYEIEIPANMVAELSLSGLEGKDLIHNGQKVATAFGTIRLEPGKHSILLKVNSF
ncbi:hypothetical protein GCM10009119_32240 [Algoriphagus jejuensis]|uniref:Arylsulfatase A-like enzyme n=1 Tax=Algoriphagus jejuensis TaxID=419934 RepID=A0ABN1N381_9BACT